MADLAQTPAPHIELQPWVAPELTELPRLTQLTLQTGSPIPGGGGTGGTTVF